MDAGLLSDPGPQQPVSLDGGVGITLGSNGQVQVDDDDGSLSRPESSDITPSDDNRVPTTANGLLETNPITQFSSELFTSFPEAPSTDVQPSLTSEAVGSASPESTPIPSLLDSNSSPSIVSTELPSITPSAISQSSSPTPPEYPSSTQTLSWTSWTTSQSLSVSPSSISPSTALSSQSSTVTSMVGVSTSTESGLPTVVSSLSSYSTSQSSSQSVSASSTENQYIPSKTILAAPTPADFNVHSPTFYVGVSIGAIISVGLIAAFVAWWIRLLSRRRRRARTVVPWGKSGYGDGGGLEAGYSSNSSIDVNTAAFGALNLGSREDLAHVQTWSPGGDRDVGEPRRAEGYFNGPFYGLSDQRIPRRDYHVDFLNNYPTKRPGSTQIRHLPSHLVADDVVARHQRGALYRDLNNHPKRAREAFFSGNVHGHDGLEGEGQSPHMPRSMAERLRNLGKSTSEPHGGEPGPLPSPEGPRLGNEELEAWGHSFRTNLVNAFNAVAANLGAGAPRMNEDDKLSAPPRRSTRRSVRSLYPEKGQMDEKKLARNGSILTTSSKPWTLEETADGMGIVHLHIRELEVTNPDVRPPMPFQTLSFGDGDKFSAYSDLDKGHHDPVQTGKTRVPLVASSKPQQAFIRLNTSSARQKTTDTVNGDTMSRRSSVYSTMSARSGAFGLCHPPRFGTGNRLKADAINEEDTVVIQPDTISRLSSSNSSILPGEGARSSVDEIASRALKMRQNGRKS